jgi:hypothetical protein
MAPKFRVIAERFENINRASVVANSDVGLNEYRPYLQRERHRVAVTITGYFRTLIAGDELKLVTEGAVFRPGDDLRDGRQ